MDATDPGHACGEYVDLARRRFLCHSRAVVAALTTLPAWLPRVSFGIPTGRDVLVNVFLRGGMDGLTTCVPYGDGDLYVHRPTLAIQPPGAPNGAVNLDGFFGLAPSASPLYEPYAAGHLAFVHAAGSPDPTRSHFDAMRFMETGAPGQAPGAVDSGWLARHLLTVAPIGDGLLRGMAMDLMLPQTLAGAPATVPTADPDRLEFPGRASTTAARSAVVSGMYAEASEPLKSAAVSALVTIERLANIDFAGYSPANGAAYPDTTFGQALRSTACLIKNSTDIEVVSLDLGGWDHHNLEGPIEGAMAQLLDELSRGLLAFYRDMLASIGSLTVVVMSEFGRRVAENASLGADHGHGGCMLVMGGGIAGGQILTVWPGLAESQLDQGDLQITIDYRDILAEILARRLGNTSLDVVFPGYTPTFRGITQ